MDIKISPAISKNIKEMLVQKEVKNSIWIVFELGNSIFEVLFVLKHSSQCYAIIYEIILYVRPHPGKHLQGQLPVFLDQPDCANVDYETASESKLMEKLATEGMSASARHGAHLQGDERKIHWIWWFHQAWLSISTQGLTSATTGELAVISQARLVSPSPEFILYIIIEYFSFSFLPVRQQLLIFLLLC